MTKKIKMKGKRIEYNKRRWVKQRGKIFPVYEEQSWTVWEDDKNGIQFSNFELAHIYAILLDIKNGKEKTN